jgi:predicted DCC family thiol-disulfide oxidoreductase YuxK
VRLIRALDRHRRVTAVPYQRPGTPESHGLTADQCAREAWAVVSDGDRYPGAAAINAALSAALGTRLPLRLYALPGIRQAQDRAYSCVARNRRDLPGDVPLCRSHPERCR